MFDSFTIRGPGHRHLLTGTGLAVMVFLTSPMAHAQEVAGGNVTGGAATAVGTGSRADTRSVAVGRSARASGTASVAIGYRSIATAVDSTAIGANAEARAAGSAAIGENAVARGTDSVAIGRNSTTTSSEDRTASFGNSSLERRLIHIADGIADSDAATVGQMAAGNAATLTAANAYTDAGNAATLTAANVYADAGDATTLISANAYTDTGNAQTLASAQDFARAGDVATLASARSYADQVGAQTLASANSYTDARIAGLQFDLRQVRRHADAGTAAAIAGANIPQSVEPGRTTIGIGGGTYGGEQAFAIGASHLMANGRVAIKGSANFSGGDGSGGGVGVGFSF
ncbi:autotransporter adhesin [Sphingomonas sp. UYAg733]